MVFKNCGFTAARWVWLVLNAGVYFTASALAWRVLHFGGCLGCEDEGYEQKQREILLKS
jgi:hypothetical protein